LLSGLSPFKHLTSLSLNQRVAALDAEGKAACHVRRMYVPVPAVESVYHHRFFTAFMTISSSLASSSATE
jgi:hypothetical protein